ncbi:hypothetical protein [Actinophytocola sp.]
MTLALVVAASTLVVFLVEEPGAGRRLALVVALLLALAHLVRAAGVRER